MSTTTTAAAMTRLPYFSQIFLARSRRRSSSISLKISAIVPFAFKVRLSRTCRDGVEDTLGRVKHRPRQASAGSAAFSRGHILRLRLPQACSMECKRESRLRAGACHEPVPPPPARREGGSRCHFRAVRAEYGSLAESLRRLHPG